MRNDVNFDPLCNGFLHIVFDIFFQSFVITPFITAPHYLSLSEKVDLCSNTPSSHAQVCYYVCKFTF